GWDLGVGSSPTLNAQFPNPVLQLRIGIHSGPVVTGEIGTDTHREFTATGAAMNLASRLQVAAPPGGILISHETYRYVRGIFDVTQQPLLTVKGKSEPVRTYLVRRAKERPFRATVRGVEGLDVTTVGREQESDRLQQVYLDAFEGQRVVWAQLLGDPGIGKSRLLNDMNDWIELRPETVRLLRARASEGDEKQPYALVRKLWFDRFQIAEDAPLAQAEAKWVARFRELWGQGEQAAVDERAHSLGLLVGLPFQASPYIGAMRDAPRQVKGRALVVSRELLGRLRRVQPVVILLEDLHWIDVSSWEYLEEVLLKDPGTREPAERDKNGLFILATARPEWKPSETLTRLAWDGAARRLLPSALPAVSIISLGPLSEAATRSLLGELLQRVDSVPEAVVEDLVTRAEGVPYFAEELVNWFIDRGIIDTRQSQWQFVAERLEESSLPATLHHLLLTRLLNLQEPERLALQRGAIFGRHFWSGGVDSLGGHDSEQMLKRLRLRYLVEPQSESAFEGETEWRFRHALLREVTYESVLKRDRARLHGSAARWLETQAERAGRLDEFSGLIGEHWERAGETHVAASWYLLAGERAQAASALTEAKHFFDRALERLPEQDLASRWRVLQGREVVLNLRGERAAQKADLDALLALADRLNDDNRRALVQLRWTSWMSRRGDYPAVLQAVDAAIAAAQRAENRGLQVEGLGRKVAALARLGDIAAGREAAEEVVTLVQGVEDAVAVHALADVATYYLEPGDIARAVPLYIMAAERAGRARDRQGQSIALGNLGNSYALLGLYPEARTALEQSLAHGEAIGDRRAGAYNLLNLGYVAWRSDDGEMAQRLEEQSLAEMTAVGDAFGRAVNLLYLGYVAEQAHDCTQAVRRLTEAREALVQLGMNARAVEAVAGLARCALADGRLDEARQLAVEIWNHLCKHGPEGLESPSQVYVSIINIFDSAGDVDLVREIVDAGYAELMARAAKISKPEWRQSFLENVEENCALVVKRESLASGAPVRHS
ncbi:MAG: AAA family ATPase, partial [Anaerolineae bacterium]